MRIFNCYDGCYDAIHVRITNVRRLRKIYNQTASLILYIIFKSSLFT
ncbi:hypothetical protein ES703_67696 [subsurface metagenome]